MIWSLDLFGFVTGFTINYLLLMSNKFIASQNGAILWRHNMVPFNGAILWHVCTRLKGELMKGQNVQTAAKSVAGNSGY